MATPMLSATILTPRPRVIVNRVPAARFCGARENAVELCLAMARSVLSLILVFVLGFGGALDAAAQSSKRKAKKPKAPPCRVGCKPEVSTPEVAADTPEDEAAQRELAGLARDVHTGSPGAYQKLSAFAAKNTTNVLGARAALALGYEDYSKNHAAQALGWLIKAQNDTLLREYALYWTAQAQGGLGRHSEAYKILQTIQQDYPTTAMREPLLEAFAQNAVQIGHPQEAIDALVAYSPTTTKSTLLLERARAYQAAHQLARAAKDYQVIFYKFPLTDEAKPAGSALSQLMHALGKEYSYPGVEMQEQRAQLFYEAHKWREARAEFEKLLTMLKDPENPARQRAQLRAAQCRVQLKGSPSLIASLKTPDLDVDAERLYALSQAYRNAKKESEMFNALNTLALNYPVSKWNEEGLMAAGNYHWVELEREKAVIAYQRVLDSFPGGRNAYNCEWRIAWVAFLNRQPDADDRLTAFLLKYPVSANAVDALYWLARNAEREGNLARARSFYNKAVDRFPETYFGNAAAARLAKLGPGEENPAEFLDKIPPAPALRPLDEPIPVAAEDRWARAQALRSIAFDSSAEQELKNAYFATSSPRFLLEAAQAAFDQGHFGAGMAYARLILPSVDSRKFTEVSLPGWKALFPLPYESALRREAAKNDFDPMFAAGLIRQESTFQADAVSPKNAIGLMQVLPKTGKLLARQIKVRYTKNKLFDPEFNIELGMVYIANLVRQTGAPEYAAAAYNAGEDRIAAWKAERNYEEIPEVVESIPFTETRDYVQIVLRNTAVYRMIYGPGNASPTVTAVTQSR
ncbi:MAG TPA: transglycosylase SLT domain-containing protein [Candidatus Acidoferrum sp.]|nr:transglycosylase SLT domain-containing protein [Candidatus Acidoferrum sp.]